jgi:hypothetical protein
VLPLAKYKSIDQERAGLQGARLSTEVERGLEAAQRRPQEAAMQRFAKTVVAIRWSNPDITDLVDTFVQIELQRRQMPGLDVCKEIREWAASGYRKLPAATSGELTGAIGRRWTLDSARVGCGKFSPATPTEVLRAVRAFQQPGRHPTTRDVELMETQLVLAELRAREGAARSLGQALGVSTTLSESSNRRSRKTAPQAFPEPQVFPEPEPCSGKPELISEPVKERAGSSQG